MSDNNISSSVTFLGEELVLPMNNRKDTSFMLYLSLIELIELKYGDGMIWLQHMERNYGLSPVEDSVKKDIKTILTNHKVKKK